MITTLKNIFPSANLQAQGNVLIIAGNGSEFFRYKSLKIVEVVDDDDETKILFSYSAPEGLGNPTFDDNTDQFTVLLRAPASQGHYKVSISVDPKEINMLRHDYIVTFEEFEAMRGNYQPLSYYTIIDHVTKHLIRGTNVIHTGVVEPIIVQAITETEISPFVISKTYPQDIIKWDRSLKVCEDGLTPRTGKIIRRIGANGLSTPFDYRNVKNRRSKLRVNTTWNALDSYPTGKMVMYNDDVYMAFNKRIDDFSIPGITPYEQRETYWRLMINHNDAFQHIHTPLYLAQGVSRWGNSVGYQSEEFYDDKYFYTFSDREGNERSDWFSDITMQPCPGRYNDIVFIETAPGQSYGNHFGAECEIMTFLERATDNRFENHVGCNAFGTDCGFNSLFGNFRANWVGNYFRENTIYNRVVSSNCIGNLYQANAMQGEHVYNCVHDGFAQNVAHHDLTMCTFMKNCCYNEFGTNTWMHCFGTGFQLNRVGYNCENIEWGDNCTDNVVWGKLKYGYIPSNTNGLMAHANFEAFDLRPYAEALSNQGTKELKQGINGELILITYLSDGTQNVITV